MRNVKTIAVVAQKGGAGKTTLAIHLAVAAERDDKTAAVIDLDPQASAVTWSDVRAGETRVVVRTTEPPSPIAVSVFDNRRKSPPIKAGHVSKLCLQYVSGSNVMPGDPMNTR
jgi:cellulose biosynthesis protein BcsQ